MSDKELELMDEWPNCAVPDCEYKSCRSIGSDKCYPHSTGQTPMPFDEYITQDDTEDEDV